ncbi:hypothetical protein D915_000006 [Fasciola hepatica]|uniref:Uncharacterized protein n=1 Tax=Fasciola hepatica TaxID=6192 RepID=A0A2H1CZD4_FASHE|nr:hypothetical protein D915_000006 [Fasciola hepatica]
MCEVTDAVDDCGDYSDFPPNWGYDKLDSDETALLVIGIILDTMVVLFCTLIVAFKFGEEARCWLRTRLMGQLHPYEKIADYLRGTDTAGLAGPTAEAAEEERVSVGAMEAAGEFLDETTEGKEMLKADRRDAELALSGGPLESGVQEALSKAEARRKRLRRKPAASSNVFLPISRAKPRERLPSSSESEGSSSWEVRSRKSNQTAASITGLTRVMPKWDGEKQ